MALSTKTMRGLIRYLPGTQRDGGAVPRLIIHPGDTTPTYEPLYIRPTEVPQGTLAEGAMWWDDDNHTLAGYDGTNNIEFVKTKSGNAAYGLVPVYTTTQILTAADNGAYCDFSVTTVTTYTLPAAAAGMHFHFGASATAAGTADIFRIVCATGDFFLGTFIQSTDGTYTSAAQDANGTTHLAWEGNGSTTGGLKGDWLDVWASSSSVWRARGMGRATGTEATPWKTS